MVRRSCGGLVLALWLSCGGLAVVVGGLWLVVVGWLLVFRCWFLVVGLRVFVLAVVVHRLKQGIQTDPAPHVRQGTALTAIVKLKDLRRTIGSWAGSEGSQFIF